MAGSELDALNNALTDIPFIDEEIAAQLRKQKLLRETWPDLDQLLATEHLSPASRKPCLEFVVRSELLRILREGWRTQFPEHTPHSFHSLAEIQQWLFLTPSNVPPWLRIVLSRLETFQKFLNDYLASNPGARTRDEDHGALEPAIKKYVDALCRACQRPEAVDPADSDQTGKGHDARKRKRMARKLPYSGTDDALFKKLGGHDQFLTFTDAELWERHRQALVRDGYTQARFRASSKRIRHKHHFPLSREIKNMANQSW